MLLKNRAGFAAVLRLNWIGLILAFLLLLSTLFGGGGGEGPVNNGGVEAASAVVLLALAAGHFSRARPLPADGAVPVLLLLFLLAIVGAQLIPLPPSIWHALPGRDLPRSALALVGEDNSWRPLSLDPEATRRFAASLLTPVALLVGVLGSTRREARLLALVIVAAAVVSAAIGALQIALDYPSWITFYDGANPGSASGVFANANHQASLLLTAMVCTALLIAEKKVARAHGQRRTVGALPFHPGWIAIPFLIAAVLATKSLAGAGLLLFATVIATGIALANRRVAMIGIGLAACAIIGVALVLPWLSGQSPNASSARSLGGDLRFAFLPDIMFGLKQYWPWGSGAGTFSKAFVTIENLDLLQPENLAHAHDDVLEWLTEFGAPGAAWLVAGLSAIAWHCVRQLRRTAAEKRRQTFLLSGVGMLLLIGLHSLVDFPVRTDALGAITGVAAGLVFAPLAPDRRPAHWRRGGKLVLVTALLVGVALGAQAMRLRMTEAALRANRPLAAAALRPQNADALALAAEAQLATRKVDLAQALAASAIDRSPLTVTAVSVLGGSALLSGRDGTAAWQVASAMGWRDQATQFWAMQQAFAGGQYPTAAARADAILRIDSRPETHKIVRTWASNPRFGDALAERLQLNPGWRTHFFAVGPDTSDEELKGVVVTLAALARAKALRRADARGAILALLERRQYSAAARMFGMLEPQSAQANLNPDPGFSRPASAYLADATPFDWQLSPGPGTLAEVDPSTHTLVIESNGRTAKTVVYRYILASPGRYVMSYRVKGDAAAPSSIQPSASCVEGGTVFGTSPSDDLRSGDFESRRFEFEVAPTCPALFIAFAALANGSPARAEFDDVLISRR